MEVKLVITNGKRPQVVRLRADETLIGRQRDCDLRIPSPEISRRHCRLSVRDGCVRIEDLASANGSFLNGALITGQEVVRPGDEIQLGPIRFRVEYALTAAALDQLLPAPPLAVRPPPLPGQPPARARQPKPAPEVIPIADELPPGEEDANTINLEDLEWRAPADADVRDILSKLEGD